MAQGKIIVTSADLRAASQKVESIAKKYRDEYTTLYTIIDSISESGFWQGADNMAYVQQINMFKNDFQAMEQLMIEYAAFLKKTADGYEAIQSHTADQATKKLLISV